MEDKTIKASRLLHERWRGMIRRTSDPNHDSYADYGGRGIAVCERWVTFENFVADLGPTFRDGLTLDRVDVNGNYEPSNVRWATLSEQSRNRRDSKLITWQGRTMHVYDWAEPLGVSAESLSRRLRRGWSVEQALTQSMQRGKFPAPRQSHAKQSAFLKLVRIAADLRSIVENGEMSDAVRQQLSGLIKDLDD